MANCHFYINFPFSGLYYLFSKIFGTPQVTHFWKFYPPLIAVGEGGGVSSNYGFTKQTQIKKINELIRYLTLETLSWSIKKIHQNWSSSFNRFKPSRDSAKRTANVHYVINGKTMRRPSNKFYPVEFNNNKLRLGNSYHNFIWSIFLFVVVLNILRLFSWGECYNSLSNISP